MKKFKLKSTYKKTLSDTVSPVGIYFRLRDRFANSILLESSDYHGDDHSMSYICVDPIARFEVGKGNILTKFPDESEGCQKIINREDVAKSLSAFSKSFETDKLKLPFITEGVFGYSSYNAVRYFEDVEISDFKTEERAIPDMIYQVYRFILVFNHFNNELTIIEHSPDDISRMDEIERFLQKKSYGMYKFQSKGEESSNLTDNEFVNIVKKGIAHCQRGDVFQVVLSRRFEQGFEGDDFNVYRTLRSINPSPYLFYFDFGNFKLFGSSPEAQIVIEKNKATIHPIAGTFRRTGNDTRDYKLAKKLFEDPKESSEHIMLVDLARNDLSRHGSEVKVERFKEIQFYSHVIHMASKVTGKMDKDIDSTQLFADTFPAGTLSGAPKHMAMSLINKYEYGSRGYYGGAIGHLSFEGDLNHAIMIRTFMSKENTLYYQAGAGIVVKSNPESELQEVNNKLAALKKAIDKANEMFGEDKA